MKRLLSLCSALLIGSGAIGQNNATINNDNLNTTVEKLGSLFTDNGSAQKSGFTAKEGQPLVFASNLWYAGYDQNRKLRGALETFRTGQEMHISGTINTERAFAVSALTKVTSEEVLTHIDQYQEAGYEIPQGILNWPANGDTTIGEMWQMAPFIDLNENEVYEPELGEYPNIVGDECIYLIKNDGGSTFETPIGIEEHYMISLFEEGHGGSEFLGNTMLLNITLYHRGNEAIDTLHVGMFHDGDLGYPSDDYTATSEAANALLFFNGDNLDSENAGQEPGFGTSPPGLAIGSMFCNLWGSMFIQNGLGPLGYPKSAEETYFYLNGKWLDGTCQIQKGSGHIFSHEGGDINFTRFGFDGDIESETEWTESNADNPAGDRRGVMILQPKSFHPGDKISYTMAYHMARNFGTNIDNAQVALYEITQVETDLLEQFGDHPLLVASRNCETLEIDQQCAKTVGVNEQVNKAGFLLYPNPSEGLIHLQLNRAASQVVIYNTLGKAVEEFTNPSTSLTLELAAGQYFVQVQFTDGTVGNEKIIVQ